MAGTSAARPRLLERLALHRPELRAWALYDWANSAYFTVVITAVFPVFFARVAAAGAGEDEVRGRFGLATTLCMTVAALLGPVLGAMADQGRLKKKLFALFLGLGVLSTLALAFVGRGDFLLAAVLFGLGNVGIASSFVFYDALLPHVARPGEADRLSTTAYAIGYLGGGLCLALCLGLILLFPDRADPAGGDWPAARAGFALVAAWWLTFTIPFLRSVREPDAPARPGDGRGLVARSFRSLVATLRELRTFRHAFLMLLAFLAYSDGIGTIIRMATLYAHELAIPDTVSVGCILLVQIVGIPFAILFGALAGRIGAKRAILLALLGYVGVCLWASRVANTGEFVAMAVMVGMVQGGAQALSRSLFASLVPKRRSGQFFGLFSTLEKFAGIFGPWIFSVSMTNRSAILSIAGFFVVGGALLAFVDVEAGRRVAEEADRSASPR